MSGQGWVDLDSQFPTTPAGNDGWVDVNSGKTAGDLVRENIDKRPTSQSLGYREGYMGTLTNVVKRERDVLNRVGINIDPLFKTDDGGTLDNAMQHIFGEEEKTTQPGTMGRIAGQVVGTLPAMAITKNPWVGGAIAGGALSDSNDPAGFATDVGLGALGGKAGDIAGGLLGRVVRPAYRAAARGLGNIRAGRAINALDPDAAARQYVGNLMETSGKSLDDLSNTDYLNKPVTSAEAIGPPGVSAVTALSRRTGQTGNYAKSVLTERGEGANDRILDDFSNAIGIHPDAARGDIDALVQAGQNKAAPLFRQATETPGPIWNTDLSRLAKRPAVKKAIAQAANDLMNADIHPGKLGLPSGGFEGELLPTAQAWDMVRKALRFQVERDPFGKVIPDSQSPGNFNLNAATRDLTAELRKSIPGYGDALDVSGDYLSAKNAFDTGQRFIRDTKVTAKQFADKVAGLSGADADAFKGGVANHLFDLAQSNKLNPGLFDKPILRSKILSMFGDEDGTNFLARMKAESDMGKAGGRMMPGTNSTTFEAADAAANHDTFSTLSDLFHAAKHSAKGDVASAATRIYSILNRKGFFGKEGDTAVKIRDASGRMLLMHPQDLSNYLATSAYRDPAIIRQISNSINAFRPALAAASNAALIDLRQPQNQ